MTSPVLHLRGGRPRTARRAEPLVGAFAGAAVVGLIAVWLAIAAAAPVSHPGAGSRFALVVVADGRPDAALDRARTAAGPGVVVRIPRTPSELATDLRYLAASGVDRVVVAGPGAAVAAREVAASYPRTRFVVR